MLTAWCCRNSIPLANDTGVGVEGNDMGVVFSGYVTGKTEEAELSLLGWWSRSSIALGQNQRQLDQQRHLPCLVFVSFLFHHTP